MLVAVPWDSPRRRTRNRTRVAAFLNGASGAAASLLDLLALLLPARDRERFVGEVLGSMADRQRWWQRLDELRWMAAAVPGRAVIVRWARRRRT